MIIIPILIIGFSLGYFYKGAMIKEDQQIYKNHKDVLNWLKSDLAMEEKVKIVKNINRDKVRYLNLIIQRLNRLK